MQRWILLAYFRLLINYIDGAITIPTNFLHCLLLTEDNIQLMQSQDWQSLWAKVYNNSSDTKWKTQSLNPMPLEQYPIPLPKAVKKPVATISQTPNDKIPVKKEETSNQEQLLPSPKMNKINDTMFCISMERDVHLFYLITNPEEKAKMKVKKAFGMVSICLTMLQQKIEFITGSGSNQIFVCSKNFLLVVDILDSRGNGTKDGLKFRCMKNIPQLLTVLPFRSNVFALTSSCIYQFSFDKEFKTVSEKKIQFINSHQENLFRTLSPVGLITGTGRCFYYFGSRIQEQIDISKLKGEPGEETQRKVKSQALTIVRISIEGQEKIDQAKGKVYPIDHVFQLGIFTRSKIYQIEKQTFLVSLHEEVVLIKKNFDRYIVWDNVSVVSSKSQSKKGQLILADKNILVFSQNIQIYAHEIFLNKDHSKLQMEAIDNFKGNDNDEQILYDALLLSYEGSFMKVLAYIKPSSVIYPTNDSNFKKKETDPSKSKDEPTQLQFTIICISQSNPRRKLQQLIGSNKTNQQIEAFCKRFEINKQDQTKSRWNVSQKKLKDIENILMQIQEDSFIQNQLDDILKKQSHSLDFLGAVEAKQLSRLNRLLVDKIIYFSENLPSNDGEKFAKDQNQYISKILQWYMQSSMFLKKINYSKTFLSFKEYDFIEIGKLKAASLKQQIKLLSSKNYQKRLKLFLNAFRILVIANYEEVFEFLLEKKSIKQIQNFLLDFRFILPKFRQTSLVYIRQKQYRIYENTRNQNTLTLQAHTPQANKRQRALSFAAGANDDLFFKQIEQKNKDKSKQKEKQVERATSLEKTQKQQVGQRCTLWDPIQDSQKQSGKITVTLEYFHQKIISQIKAVVKSQSYQQKAVNIFKKMLQTCIASNWFKNAAFKQHAMITKTTKQLQQQFTELKRKGAFKILVKYLYKKINNNPQLQESINEMLNQLIKVGAIPSSFKINVDARVQVYRSLLERKNAQDGKRLIGLQLPLLEDFVVWAEDKYFDFLFRNIRNNILKQVKEIYDTFEVGFFKQRFQMFLKSDLISPDDIIQFLDSFNNEIQADDIRIDVFKTIKRLLRLGDKINSKKYIDKSMDREVLPENEDVVTGKLREQAKIPFGYFFYNFFKAFKLDYSYQQFIEFTNTPKISDCKIIQELISRYCKCQYRISETYQGGNACEIQFQEGQGIHQKLPSVDIHNQPLQLFGLILHLLDVLNFQIEEIDVFKLMLENYLNEHKFKQLSQFIKKINEYHVTEYNLRTNNYKMISDFKEQIDVDRTFIDYVLGWMKKNYNAIADKDTMVQLMKANQNALIMLSQYSKNASQIRKQKSLFELLSNLRKFDEQRVLNVQLIKKQALSHSSFIFLMHRFTQIGVDRFKQYSKQQQQWLLQINNFSQLFISHKSYAYQEIADPTHPDFLRFLIQLCIIMIQEGVYKVASYLITRRIPNDQYYFKDVLLLFLTAIKIEDHRRRQFKEMVNKHILLPETTSIIKENLENKILAQFNVREFIPVKMDEKDFPTMEKKQSKKKQKDEKEIMLDKQREILFVKRSIQMFQMILDRNRKDDAYFYLVRAKRVWNKFIIKIPEKNKGYVYGDQIQKIRQNIEFRSYLLASSYIKALQHFIQKQFYPTQVFFESKMIILQDPRQRKDMIKDVNIALSKLGRIKIESAYRKYQLHYSIQELEQAYNNYMEAVGEDPNIKLADDENKGLDGTKRVEIYSRKSNDILHKQNKEEVQYKKELQRNLEKVNQIQQQYRNTVINKEISDTINQIKKQKQRHATLEAQFKKQDKQESLAVRRQRQLQEIRKKQKDDIESIKDTYKSSTTKRVNELIQNLRKNREKVAAKRVAPTSAIRDDPRDNYMKPQNIAGQPSFKPRMDLTLGIPQSPKSEPMADNLLPITMKERMKKIETIREEIKSNQPNTNILQLQKRMFSQQQVPQQHNQQYGAKKKINFEDIAKIYKEKQSQQAYKCIQKYDMLKNAQVRTELIKRVYALTIGLQNFLQFLKFLINLDPTWKQSIQEKSIGIAAQMIKMHSKDKISIKQIIPAQFYTSITKISLKDYYGHAFELFKPNIKKIFQKDLMAVQAVGILIRYTLGSENRFYNKVFYEYFKVMLKNYEIKNMDDKELTFLAEKIRSNYSSLPDNKDQVLEQLLLGVSNPMKRARLLETLKRTIERKGQSLVGGQANKEIGYILTKLMK